MTWLILFFIGFPINLRFQKHSANSEKPVLNGHSKKIVFQDQLLRSKVLQNAPRGEHSAILSTFLKLPLILSLRSLFCLFLRVAVLHRFYCMFKSKTKLTGNKS